MISENDMARFQREGAEEKLLDLAGKRLWTAKQFIEEASKERFKDFQDRVDKARKSIDEAEQLFRQTYNL